MANTNEDQLSQTGRSYYKIGDNGNWWEGYDGSSWIDTGEVVNIPGPIYIQGIQGPRGPQGTNGEPIPGPKGATGPAGPQGPEGPRGTQGIQGVAGKDFSITKTFTSVNQMIASGGEGLTEGDFAMISSTVEDPDNAKLYLWNGNAFTYVSDLSGATGIKGDKGDQGVKGDQGIQGPQGPQGTPGKDGTNADSAYKIITIEGSPLNLSQGVRTFTAFDSKTGANIPNFSVNIISSNWTSKYSIHRLTFLQSPMDKAAGLDSYSAIDTESTSAIHDCDVYGSLDIQGTTRSMQLKLVPADLTVNNKAFGSDGNAQIDATNIQMGGGSTKLISEAIASKADATNVVTSVNGFTGDTYVTSRNIVLNHRTNSTMYFSWIENGSTINREVSNIQVINVLTSATIQLTPPSVEVSYNVGSLSMRKGTENNIVKIYSGATMATTVQDYTMRYINFTISENGTTNVVLYVEPINAPVGVLPIDNGGTSNTVGRAQSVNGNGLIFNSLAVGGTVVGTANLSTNYAKMLGSFSTTMPNSPIAGKVFHTITTNDGTDRLDIIAVAKVTGEMFTGQAVGTISDNTFTVTTAPTWKRVFNSDSVIPIENGGTGNTAGTATSLTMIDIAKNTDLNTIVTPGLYVNRSDSTTGITNAPSGVTTNFFMMEVYATSIRTVMQRYWDFISKKWFIRGSSGNPSKFSDWEEVGSGSVIYSGSFGWDITPFTGVDSFRKRSKGSVINIAGDNTGIVRADPNDSGVALFTNSTSKPIKVIMNNSFTVGRATGTADTLPKKFNIALTNADIDGGIRDNAHLMSVAGSVMTFDNVGYTNNQSLLPTYFTVPANSTFRLSFEIDGYGNISDTYNVSGNVTYIAFSEDAKVSIANTVDWNSGFTLASGWTLRSGGTNNGFMIRNGDLFVNLNALQTQAALNANSTTLMATVPNVSLYGISRLYVKMIVGVTTTAEGYIEIDSSGRIYFHNFNAVPAQTGSNYNQVSGFFKIPIKI